MIIASHLKNVGFRPKGIVHVGAHHAEELQDYADLRPEVIVWIEADPATFANLERFVAAGLTPNIRQVCLNALIGQVDGERIEFHHFNNNGESSSIFAPTALLKETWSNLDETGTEEFVSARLDTLLNSHGFRPADLDVVIFDIQGAELLALKGSGAYLDSAEFVEVELSQAPIYEGAPLAPEVDKFISDAGFDRITGIPWHGDAIYQRRR